METHEEISGQASLVLIGKVFTQMQLWSVVTRWVKVKQKVRQHRPEEKLLDAFINMLTGGLGVVEVNTRVRSDRAVQRAFGRKRCAEQSGVSRTLNACNAQNILQMKQALREILRQHGRCCQHDYAKGSLLLDVDLTGLVAGAQGEGVTKGYFAHQRNRRGRQLGRVLATAYAEIVEEQLYDGKRQLNQSLIQLVDAAVYTRNVPQNKHNCIILRVDGGAGDDDSIKWILNQGYAFITKVKNWNRARILARSVTRWYPDGCVPDRQIGWVTRPHMYLHPTRQVALRFPVPTPHGPPKYHYQVLVYSLSHAQLAQLCGRSRPTFARSLDLLRAVVHAYDLRDGGLETQNRADKSGLGLSHRNKRSRDAQEMLVLLCQLAHNFIIWTHHILAAANPHLAHFGIKRTVRDLHHISGTALLTDSGEVAAVTLQADHPYANALLHALSG
jgi:hypothetical protein